jgi:hypothetical protein
LTLDWGVNGAVLFGRQKSNSHHQTTVRSYYKTVWQRQLNGIRGSDPGFKPGHFEINYGTHQREADITIHTNTGSSNRARTVAVPNLGAFAGVSYRYSDVKLSLGYRADFFFGAMDGGIDAAKKENRGFYGPFASVSVGIGG